MNGKLDEVQNWSELAKEAKWSVVILAKYCGVSARTLERYFLKSIGITPKTWLNEERQVTAIKLRYAGNSVKETAYYLGYRQTSTFSREFTKFWGFPPIQAEAIPRSYTSLSVA